MRQRRPRPGYLFWASELMIIARHLIPHCPDLILASSGEEDFFVKKSRKAAFEPKTFLVLGKR